MQSTSRDRILEICTQLLDSLMARHSVARVTGPPVEYIVNQASGNVIVALLNNSGSDWSGNIAVRQSAGVTGVIEYITDQPVEFSSAVSGLTIRGQVPAYGVRVFGIEYDGAAAHRLPPRKKGAGGAGPTQPALGHATNSLSSPLRSSQR
jgi:hypothetical protein